MVKNLATGKIWTPFEDDLLIATVQYFGGKNWNEVSLSLASTYNLVRTPKQCRDRWTNSLKSTHFSSFLSNFEKSQILQLFLEYGNKWSFISQTIKTKSENQIKNFINSTLRRNLRRFNSSRCEEEKIKCNSLDLFKIQDIRYILCAGKERKKEWFQDQMLTTEAKRQIRAIEESCVEELEDNSFEIVRESGNRINNCID